jgi:hypothetical protein
LTPPNKVAAARSAVAGKLPIHREHRDWASEVVAGGKSTVPDSTQYSVTAGATDGLADAASDVVAMPAPMTQSAESTVTAADVARAQRLSLSGGDSRADRVATGGGEQRQVVAAALVVGVESQSLKLSSTM